MFACLARRKSIIQPWTRRGRKNVDVSREEEERKLLLFFIEFDGSISCVPNTFIGLRSTMEHISIYIVCWSRRRRNYRTETPFRKARLVEGSRTDSSERSSST
jgi:hypothetical protein